jgi:hypothetical protein
VAMIGGVLEVVALVMKGAELVLRRVRVALAGVAAAAHRHQRQPADMPGVRNNLHVRIPCTPPQRPHF